MSDWIFKTLNDVKRKQKMSMLQAEDFSTKEGLFKLGNRLISNGMSFDEIVSFLVGWYYGAELFEDVPQMLIWLREWRESIQKRR